MKAARALLLFVLLIFFSSPALAKKPIADPAPVNFRLVMPQYLYQEVNAFEVGLAGGGAMQTGSYFFVLAGIGTGEFLGDFEDIIDVKAEHLETGRQYSCAPWHCTFLADVVQQSWRVLLRPEQWMFEGTWEFTMSYWGRDPDSPQSAKKVVHIQRAQHRMGPVTFPIKPSYVNVVKSEDGITLSWSAIGNPRKGPVDYEVWILNENNCPQEQLKGNWADCSGSFCGLFDAVRNRVIFQISSEWQGHFVILRNRIHVRDQSSEARRIIRLP